MMSPDAYERVVRLLVTYWREEGPADLSMYNTCRQLADMVVQHLPTSVSEAIRGAPRTAQAYVTDIQDMLVSLTKSDPVAAELLRNLSEAGQSPPTQRVSVVGDYNQVITAGRDISGLVIQSGPTAERPSEDTQAVRVTLPTSGQRARERGRQMAPSTSNVFISYNHQDKGFVRRLVDDLSSRGVKVWWDEWEIGVGESIVKRVSEGINSSAYLATVLSPNSVDSRWVQYELDSAMMKQLSAERGIAVLPLVVADCEMPLSLRHIKYADFRSSYDYGLHQLLRAIGVMGFPWIKRAAEKIVQAGRDAARADQYDEAEERFWEVLEQFPDYPPALSGLANVRYYQGRYQEGINCANKAINVDPEFPYAYYQRALCRWAAGNSADAVKDLEHALDLKPDLEYVRNKLSELKSVADPMEDYKITDALSRAPVREVEVEFGFIDELGWPNCIYHLSVKVKNRGVNAINHFKLQFTFLDFDNFCQEPGCISYHPELAQLGNATVSRFDAGGIDHIEVIYRSKETLFPDDEMDVGAEIGYTCTIKGQFNDEWFDSARTSSERLSWTLYADEMPPKRGEIPFVELFG